jgi:hypothetical protein
MPRRKHPLEWTNEEVLQKLFPPPVRKHLKRAVKEATEKAEKRGKKKPDSSSESETTP